MQYLALIYSAEDHPAPDDLIDRYGTMTREMIAAGVFKSGDALKPVSTATSVRVRDGKRHVTDGPFAETKEQLGGYYLMECDSLDQALDWAARIPTSEYGTIEVRPIHDYSS